MSLYLLLLCVMVQSLVLMKNTTLFIQLIAWIQILMKLYDQRFQSEVCN